ncbi:SH3 domain-containing protein [Parablautia muri]|uniref:SH3 domain-containing protein n=1 Tax=Parablautia muri TaxID=2320879 RepID=A0A9X5GSQ5_9FIRM|nr:SH3 domain-containing protein [Parablautia muri]NBJ93414.1 SH3 domain-containing protein [Parablautia muri]
MSHSDQNKTHGMKEKFISAVNWIMDHSKMIMPLVLVFCVIITIVVAVNANQKKALEKEAQQTAVAVTSGEGGSAQEGEEVQIPELEKNAYPELNQLISDYYDAQASGDMETITSLNTYLNEIETIRVQELSKYIDSYSVLDVYTKPGMEENTYVAYVCSEVKFTDADQALPGMQTYYIGIDDNGEYFINDGTYDDVIWNYIKEATLQDDVVDLNNKIVVEYNELLAEDEDLKEFIAYLKEKINEDVGEILAAAEIPEENEEETEAEQETQEEEQPQQTVIRTVRATDVVNIRKSDSEEADKIDKAQVGQEFTLLEERGNGWSQVEYNGGSAYIKSDYLEVISEETTDTDTLVANNEQPSQEPETAPAPASTTASSGSNGKVKVKESVKVRKSASTDAEALGTAYTGDELELVMKQADGWTKVKYNGQTAFVKSDYVE